MNVYFITFRSVTPAQRGERILTEEGLRVTLARTPRWMEERGCGYSLRFRTGDPVQWTQLLRRQGVDFRKVYRRREDGSVEEVTL
ncbi:MAG: DUF3343 domain-containing protein [Oscillospiraceae bacterium]|nr:DUF3343 domain-containing protein [Oscillospiraceae bacterium]